MCKNIFVFDRSSFLNLKNKAYKKSLREYFDFFIEQDLQDFGDVTSDFVFGKKTHDVKLVAKSREKGIFCGKEEIKYFLDLNGLKSKFFLDDGDFFDNDKIFFEIIGNVKSVLKIERLVLNFLSRMISVASFTKKIVDIANKSKSKTKIASTRKTLFGLFDKKASFVGGSLTHRLGLFDAIMIKDNHISLFDSDLKKIFDKKMPKSVAFIEIELEKKNTVIEFAKKLKNKKGNFCIMLDNFSPKNAKKTIDELKEKDLFDNIIFELSGNINDKNVLDYLKVGADIISMSQLTNPEKNIDIGLDYVL